MLYIQKCSYNICSHTCSNSELCNVVIVHRAQGNSRTIGNFWSIVLYVQTLSEICNNILVKFIDIPTSVMAYHEHCILVQQKVDILVAFTNSVLHQSVHVSEIQTSLPGHQRCEHFRSICVPMSLFSLSVRCKGILGYGGLAPILHTHLTSWGDKIMLCLYFLQNCYPLPDQRPLKTKVAEDESIYDDTSRLPKAWVVSIVWTVLFLQEYMRKCAVSSGVLHPGNCGTNKLVWAMSVKRPTIIRLNTVYQMAGFVGCARHHRLHSTWDSGPIIVKAGVHPMSVDHFPFYGSRYSLTLQHIPCTILMTSCIARLSPRTTKRMLNYS